MASYFERYLDGQYKEVWAELVALGSEIRQEPVYQDALAVANETMQRAKDNIETLILRLYEVDYQFVCDPSIYRIPNKKDSADLEKIKREIDGPLPLSIEAWYKFVGEVSFLGEDFECQMFDSAQRLAAKHISPEARSVTLLLNPDEPLSDPFESFAPDATWDHIDNLKTHYEEGYVSSRNRFIDFDPDDVNKPPIEYEFVISGSPLGKTYQQDGDLNTIIIPNPAMDVPIIGTADWENLTFVEYLRENFLWGGFPGLKKSKNPPKELLAFLTKDLLPI